MRNVTLRVEKCFETGEMGLIVDGVSVPDQMVVASGDMAGVLIAHDLVEHLHGPANIGGAAEELIALGAVWYVRGRHGDITRKPNVNAAEAHLASDVSMQCYNAWIRQDRCWDIQDWAVFEHRGPGMMEDALVCIFREARAEMRENYERRPGDFFKFFLGARRFMRHGYAVMDARYHDNPLHPNRMFWNIAEAIDGYVKYSDMWLGQKATLMYDMDTGTATVADVEDRDEYAYDEEDWDEARVQ